LKPHIGWEKPSRSNRRIKTKENEERKVDDEAPYSLALAQKAST